MASKIFAVYSKIIGSEYLWMTLGLMLYELYSAAKEKDSVKARSSVESGSMGGSMNGSFEMRPKSASTSKSLLASSTSVELDPSKMTDSDDFVTNKIQLQLLVHKLWKIITSSQKAIPKYEITLFRELTIFQ